MSNCLAPEDWPHTTSDNCLKEKAGVDLFHEDVDGETHTAVYVRYVDGTRCPARTVYMGDKEHADSVLNAWCKSGIVHDYRDQSNNPKPHDPTERENQGCQESAKNAQSSLDLLSMQWKATASPR